MISPHTPPGTKVVLLSLGSRCVGCVTGLPMSPETTLKVGGVYTLARIVPNPFSTSGFLAELVGERSLVGLHLLRRLELPDCLTSLLDTAPVRDEVDV